MFRWKREKGGGVISYRLYLLGNRTSIFIMREHGFSGNWVGRVGITSVLEDKLLGQVKASLEMLLECSFAFQEAEEHWKATRDGFKGSKQRFDEREKWAYHGLLAIEEDVDSVLGAELKVDTYQALGFCERVALGNTIRRLRAKFRFVRLD